MYCHTYPYMNRELIARSMEYKPCTAIGKNLKSVIPLKQILPRKPCADQNKKYKLILEDLSMTKYGTKCTFSAQCFSEYPTACIFDKAKGPNEIKNVGHVYTKSRNWSFNSIGSSKTYCDIK